MNRDDLGRVVRRVWVHWAARQPAPKASWLVGWEQLSEPEREVDRRIGQTVWALAIEDYQARVRRVLEEERARARQPLTVPARQTAQRDRSRARAALLVLDLVEAALLPAAGACGPAEATPAQDARHELERGRAGGPA
jgi:hypothetical protein